MRIHFVHHVLEDRGSAQDMFHYARAAEAIGHEICLYGPARDGSSFDYSRQIDRSDAVVFIFEWTTALQAGDPIDWLRLVARVPRHRRLVIDCDGKYNEAISVQGDENHAGRQASRLWREICDSLADKICQPTFHPQLPNVLPFLFHAYSPTWERDLDLSAKPLAMTYVGNNWFRWRALERVLRAIQPIREEIGRLRLVGNGWAEPAPWANDTLIEDAYRYDSDFLAALDVETAPPVPFHAVIEQMGCASFNPVIYRPLFDHLGLVTCRSFETPAANTIPLFCQDEAFIRELYGEAAAELVFDPDGAQAQMLHMVYQPEHYTEPIEAIREHLRANHSYERRIRSLLELLE